MKRGHSAEARTAAQWRAWSEQRLRYADGYVEALRDDARQANRAVRNAYCETCTVLVIVPMDHGKHRWEMAYVQHELGCSARL